MTSDGGVMLPDVKVFDMGMRKEFCDVIVKQLEKSRATGR